MTNLRRRNVVAGWTALNSCLLAIAVIASPIPVNAEMAPASGTMLIASRDLNDPNFSQSVILLFEHNEGGSMGVVINRPTRVSAHEALPQIEGLDRFEDNVYFGGPVDVGTMVLLFRASETPQGATRILGDIHVARDAAVLHELVGQGLDDMDLRLYAGYAGWHAGQLDMEITRGGWHVLPGKANLVFDRKPADIWEKLLPPPDPIMVLATPPVMALQP
jgi:putative transcriptional regulator